MVDASVWWWAGGSEDVLGCGEQICLVDRALSIHVPNDSDEQSGGDKGQYDHQWTCVGDDVVGLKHVASVLRLAPRAARLDI